MTPPPWVHSGDVLTYEQLLARLKEQLRERGLTYDDAVKGLGHNRSWLSKILNGEKNAYLRDFVALCVKNDLTPGALFAQDDSTARLLDTWSRLDESSRRQALAVLDALAQTSTAAKDEAFRPPATPGSRKHAR